MLDGVDKGVGDAAEAEAAAEEGGVAFEVCDCFVGGGDDFVDLGAFAGGGEGAGEMAGL